jgi:hypothetical protein
MVIAPRNVADPCLLCLLLESLLLLVSESSPALSELLSDGTKCQVGALLDDNWASLLAKEHVPTDLLLAPSGLLLRSWLLRNLWWHLDSFLL